MLDHSYNSHRDIAISQSTSLWILGSYTLIRICRWIIFYVNLSCMRIRDFTNNQLLSNQREWTTGRGL